jgi:hypothetical protein
VNVLLSKVNKDLNFKRPIEVEWDKNWKMYTEDGEISGLYYKHIMIIIDAASVVSKWRSKL